MRNQSAQSLALPPGSFGLPVVGETFSFLKDSQQFALKRHARYEPVFKTHIIGRPTLFIRGAEALRFVLTNENKYFANSLPPTTKALLGERTGRKTWGYWQRMKGAAIPLLMEAFGHATQQQTLSYLCIQAQEVEEMYQMEL